MKLMAVVEAFPRDAHLPQDFSNCPSCTAHAVLAQLHWREGVWVGLDFETENT